MYSRVNFELKRELNRLDRSEKQQLELMKDGADFLSICGLPMNIFNKTVGKLGIVSSNEEKED